jgi:hypothetical protein
MTEISQAFTLRQGRCLPPMPPFLGGMVRASYVIWSNNLDSSTGVLIN